MQTRSYTFALLACATFVAVLIPSSQAEELHLYKACLLECYRCVKTYGKDFYNGKLCAENCSISKGRSIDAKCYPPSKRGNSFLKPRVTAECSRQCQDLCAFDYDRDNMDAHACMFTCIISQQKIVNC